IQVINKELSEVILFNIKLSLLEEVEFIEDLEYLEICYKKFPHLFTPTDIQKIQKIFDDTWEIIAEHILEDDSIYSDEIEDYVCKLNSFSEIFQIALTTQKEYRDILDDIYDEKCKKESSEPDGSDLWRDDFIDDHEETSEN